MHTLQFAIQYMANTDCICKLYVNLCIFIYLKKNYTPKRQWCKCFNSIIIYLKEKLWNYYGFA